MARYLSAWLLQQREQRKGPAVAADDRVDDRCAGHTRKPAHAIPWLEAYVDRKRREASKMPVILIGSSLGGYYADHLARRFSMSAALINPLVDTEDLRPVLGPNENYYTGARFELDEADLDALRGIAQDLSIDIPRLVLLDEGDELLDYRKAVGLYTGHARVVRYPGGSHRFDHLEQSLGEIRKLCDEAML